MSIELTPFLKDLLSLPGLSGYEGPARQRISEAWQPLVDQLSTSRMGSLHGFRRGVGAEPRPGILLAAHMDAIGLMVTGIAAEGGYLRITQIGGVDPRILPGQPVTVHGRQALPGIVFLPVDRLLPANLSGKPAPLKYLMIDTGLQADEVAQLVRPGDLVSFAQQPLELAGDIIAGHSLDNRASVAAITLCLQELEHMTTAWDVWAVATVQEEETFGGAYTSPFEIRPALAVAIDVTHATGPGVSDYRGFALGKGLVLGWGPNIHPAVHKTFLDLAKKLEIPYKVEAMARHSGTDAFAMQVVAEGIPTMVVSIPLRYMHTPVEAVALKDIERTGHLLAEFIARLEPDYIQHIKWDE
jgi:tetrahedral aminopeptidase